VTELVQVDVEEMGWKKMYQLYTTLSLKRKTMPSSESTEQTKHHTWCKNPKHTPSF
jgi:hypothetical protein